MVGRFTISNIRMILSHIHILFFLYQDINTSPCDYSGISKPVEKLPCKYVLSRLTSILLRQASIARTPLLSFRALSLLPFPPNNPPTSLFYSQARGVSLNCAADPISSGKYPVTKTSYWDHWVVPLATRRLHYNLLSMGFLITGRDLMFFWYVLHRVNYDNLILQGVWLFDWFEELSWHWSPFNIAVRCGLSRTSSLVAVGHLSCAGSCQVLTEKERR